GVGLSNFLVDQRIVEAGLGRVASASGKINARQACPMDRAQAHGTGFARGVNLAVLQLEGSEFPTRLTDGDYFCMCGGIKRRGDLIRALGNNAAVPHDHRTKRAAARMNVLDGELNGARHEWLGHVLALAGWSR